MIIKLRGIFAEVVDRVPEVGNSLPGECRITSVEDYQIADGYRQDYYNYDYYVVTSIDYDNEEFTDYFAVPKAEEDCVL
mgnify:CR=1 FL=1